MGRKSKRGRRQRTRRQQTKQPSPQFSQLFTDIQIPAAVALVSSAAMMVEISLARLFSIVLPYYFVYIVLSLAILGLGLGAFIAHWQREKLTSRETLALTPLIAALSTILTVLIFSQTASQGWWPLYLLSSVVIFGAIGVFLSRIFSLIVRRSGWLYWADLTGASLGVILAILGLTFLGGINVPLFAALLFAVSSVIIRPRFWLGGDVAVLLTLLLTINLGLGFIEVKLTNSTTTKTISAALDPAGLDGEIVFTDWDAYARTDVVAYPELPDERTIFVDGGSGSAVFQVKDGVESLAYLRNDLGYLPFDWLKPDSTLIIGPGGGKDIALALLAETDAITAVEINPGIVRALDSMSGYNSNLHRHPAVDLYVAEGRNFLKSEQRNFDLIYLSLVANEAADLAGLALAENYVYTEEAFLDYLDHLTPGGAIAMRLHDEPHLNRAFATALKALNTSGLSSSEAMNRIIVLAGAPQPGALGDMDPLLIVLVSPIPSSEATSLLTKTTDLEALPLFIPHASEQMPYLAFSQGRIEIAEFLERLGDSYAAPTTDDRPFFYLLESGLPRELSQLGLLLAGAIFVWASYILWRQRDNARTGGSRAELGWLVYFAALGLGFMMVEIAFIQQFSLFLGHPIRSLALVLGGLLFTTGLGSFGARNVAGAPAILLLKWVLVGIAVLGGMYLVLLPSLLSSLHGTSLTIRALLTLGLILPLGLLLGIPFPVGLRLLAAKATVKGDNNEGNDVALAWATNGLFSVTGSVLAMVLAIQYGFSWVWVAGLVAYLLIAGLTWRLARQRIWDRVAAS